MVRAFIGMLVFVVLTACGNVVESMGTETSTATSSSTTPEGKKAASNKGQSSGQERDEGVSLPAVEPDVGDDDSGGYLTGYVVSAFDMNVNGRRYDDSEDFYTQQLGELESEMEAAGYAGYSLSLSGELGLDDLKYGMDVYVVAHGKTGFAGDTTVNENGRFMLGIPDGSGDEVFRIRTNKRVSVILTSPDKRDVVRWCYNFSSANTEGTLHEPVLISEFTTKLTRYQCSDSGNGMTLPANPKAPQAAAAPVQATQPAQQPAAPAAQTQSKPKTDDSDSDADSGTDDDDEDTITVIEGHVTVSGGRDDDY